MDRTREEVIQEIERELVQYEFRYKKWHLEKFGVEAPWDDYAIDPGIYEMVVVLRQMRFNTAMSCEGHVKNFGKTRNNFLYPYVRIEPVLTDNLFADGFAWEGKIEALQYLVNQFYATQGPASSRFVRLHIHRQGLMTRDKPGQCFIEVLNQYFWLWDKVDRFLTSEFKVKILTLHQQEMQRFARYLQTQLS